MKWELKIRLSSDNSLVEVWYGITTITSNCCKRSVHSFRLVFSKSVRSRSRSMRIVCISAECPINYNIETNIKTHLNELIEHFFRHFAKIQTFEIYEGTSERARRMSPRFEECSKTCAWISTMLSIKDRDELLPWKVFIRNDQDIFEFSKINIRWNSIYECIFKYITRTVAIIVSFIHSFTTVLSKLPRAY